MRSTFLLIPCLVALPLVGLVGPADATGASIVKAFGLVEYESPRLGLCGPLFVEAVVDLNTRTGLLTGVVLPSESPQLIDPCAGLFAPETYRDCAGDWRADEGYVSCSNGWTSVVIASESTPAETPFASFEYASWSDDLSRASGTVCACGSVPVEEALNPGPLEVGPRPGETAPCPSTGYYRVGCKTMVMEGL